MLTHYRSAMVFAVIALVAGFWLGGLQAAWIVLILGILETSLSFDNAVVNASVLKNWDEKWRRRFLVWGMPIAVFGMRLVFPLAIVAFAAHINPWAALELAVAEPKQYETILTSVHHEIAAFGGAFLLMVFLKFFIDENKDTHWIGPVEEFLAKTGKLGGLEILITLGVIWFASGFVGEEQLAFFMAGVAGLMTFIGADALGSLAGGEEDDTGQRIIKAGVGGFLYLELLDASFSFDGVIAAFAMTNNIFIIMIGLAVGAMFVRSMTLHLVEAGTLAELRYLEHSAFWAIGSLAAIMFLGVAVEIPEAITGLIGAGAIGLGIWSSVKEKRAEDAAAKLAGA